MIGAKFTPACRLFTKNRMFFNPIVSRMNSSENKADNKINDSSNVDPKQNIELRRPLTSFDKKVLVWSGKFKNAGEIPVNVPYVLK